MALAHPIHQDLFLLYRKLASLVSRPYQWLRCPPQHTPSQYIFLSWVPSLTWKLPESVALPPSFRREREPDLELELV